MEIQAQAVRTRSLVPTSLPGKIIVDGPRWHGDSCLVVPITTENVAEHCPNLEVNWESKTFRIKKFCYLTHWLGASGKIDLFHVGFGGEKIASVIHELLQNGFTGNARYVSHYGSERIRCMPQSIGEIVFPDDMPKEDVIRATL